MYKFYNRSEAGRRLLSMLRKYQNIPGVILAVPRGGIPVAYEVAKELNIPLEIVLVKKLGHPANNEYAIGAVGLHDSFVIPHEDVTEQYIGEETKRVRRRLMEMKKKFMGDKDPENIKGKTVIIIDDGIATGNTLLATIRILRKSHPAKIIVAAPVASQSAIEKLGKEADEIVTLMIPETFYGVGAFYEDFRQLTDEKVIEYLERLNQFKKAG